MNDVLAWMLDAVQSVDPVLRTALAGLGIFLETSILIGLVVPGDSIVLVAATGVEGPVQYFALVITVVIGALCGESLGFALGRWFGPRIRASALGRRIGEKNWASAQRYVARRGGIAVFISRFLPVLHSLVPVTVGMSAMRFRTFISWTIPASIVWAFAYVSVGAFAAGSFRELSRELHGAGYVFVGIIAVFLVAVVVAKRLLGRSQKRHIEDVVEDGDPVQDGNDERAGTDDPSRPSAPAGTD